MNQKETWLQWAIELQSIAQSALYYCRDQYDRERFERIREISAEMVSHQSEIPMEKVAQPFLAGESGYRTYVTFLPASFPSGVVLLGCKGSWEV